jgi:hypothetical protein
MPLRRLDAAAAAEYMGCGDTAAPTGVALNWLTGDAPGSGAYASTSVAVDTRRAARGGRPDLLVLLGRSTGDAVSTDTGVTLPAVRATAMP